MATGKHIKNWYGPNFIGQQMTLVMAPFKTVYNCCWYSDDASYEYRFYDVISIHVWTKYGRHVADGICECILVNE